MSTRPKVVRTDAEIHCPVIDAGLRERGCELVLLPGNADLTAAEVELMDRDDRERRLRSVLSYVQKDYDLIVIDCPPSLGILTMNALTGALSCDSFLIF